MRIYVDDDSADAILMRLLRRNGHDIESPIDANFAGSSDQIHFAHAIRQNRAILTRNHHDFAALHDLVVFAAHGHDGGVLVIRFDDDPRNRMSHGAIVRAVRNLERAGIAIADSYHELNHWQ